MGCGFLIWQFTGIIPTAIFYGVGLRELFPFLMILIGLIAGVQLLAYVLYQRIYHNEKSLE